MRTFLAVLLFSLTTTRAVVAQEADTQEQSRILTRALQETIKAHQLLVDSKKLLHGLSDLNKRLSEENGVLSAKVARLSEENGKLKEQSVPITAEINQLREQVGALAQLKVDAEASKAQQAQLQSRADKLERDLAVRTQQLVEQQGLDNHVLAEKEDLKTERKQVGEASDGKGHDLAAELAQLTAEVSRQDAKIQQQISNSGVPKQPAASRANALIPAIPVPVPAAKATVFIAPPTGNMTDALLASPDKF